VHGSGLHRRCRYYYADRSSAVLQLTPPQRQSLSDSDRDRERERLVNLAAAAARPLLWDALLIDAANAGYHEPLLGLADNAA
jgi:hypothetical protein